MIRTYNDFIEADKRAEGMEIPFREVYAILQNNMYDVEEHSFRLRNHYDRQSYEYRLEHTFDLLKRGEWLLYIDKYGNIFSGIIF